MRTPASTLTVTTAVALFRAAALVVFTVICALQLAGCGDDDKPTESSTPAAASKSSPTSVTDIEIATYVSTDVTGHDLVDGTDITLSFKDGILSVAAGCTTQFAPYELTDGLLRWSDDPASTSTPCRQELVEQDRWLAQLFTDGMAATEDGSALTLANDEIMLVVTSVQDVDLTRLLGHTWTVTGTMFDGAVRRLPAPVRSPHLVVGTEQPSRLDTGCNTGRTNVRVDDDTFVFGTTTATRVRCPQPAREIERRVLAVLDGPADYVHFDGKMLVVTKGEEGLVFRVD